MLSHIYTYEYRFALPSPVNLLSNFCRMFSKSFQREILCDYYVDFMLLSMQAPWAHNGRGNDLADHPQDKIEKYQNCE